MNRLALIGLMLLAVLYSPNLLAHGFLPAKLAIEEIDPEVYMIMWEPNDSVEFGELRGLNNLQLNLPDYCQKRKISGESGGRIFYQLDCSQLSLRGHEISISGLGWNKTQAIVSVNFLRGETYRTILQDEISSMTAPKFKDQSTLSTEFITSGIWHILTGYDHILFLIVMLLIYASWQKRIQVVTAFTVGHSFSLALATLGWFNPPGAPVEVFIAWTIAFAAYEALRKNEQGPRSLTYRHPWLVTGVFGFIHGFGFASVLKESGVNGNDILWPLFSFNLGVEIGQLIVLVLSATVYMFLNNICIASFNIKNFARHSGFAVGALAMFLVLQRLIS